MSHPFSPKRLRFSVAALVLAWFLLGTGCSSQNKPLTINGSVSSQGQPVPAGIVRFHGPGDHLAMADLQPDGTFIITDVVPGEVKVTIEEDARAQKRLAMQGQPGAAGTPRARPVPIPRKYQDEATSDLVFNISPDMKKLEINLR
jgi:hypothetical protein